MKKIRDQMHMPDLKSRVKRVTIKAYVSGFSRTLITFSLLTFPRSESVMCINIPIQHYA